MSRIARYFGVITIRQNLDLSVSKEYGYAELVGFAELTAAVILLVLASIKLRDAKLKILAGIAAYVLFDDLFMIHDRLRPFLGAKFFSSYAPDKAIEFGESIYFGTAIAVIATILILAFRNASRLQYCRASLVVGGFALFAFFAVVLDDIGSLLNSYGFISDRVHRNLAMIEDVGELFAAGLIFMASLVLFRMGQEIEVSQSTPIRED